MVSARPDGEVVKIPMSRTDRIPSSLAHSGSRGISFGGADAASAKGVEILRISEGGTFSKKVRTVERVPPLAPEDLRGLVLGIGWSIEVGETLLDLVDVTGD